MSTEKILEKELTYKVIGCAMDVHNELGYGFLEKVYENSMVVALKAKDITVEKQKAIPVFFHEQQVGDYYADLFIDDKVIIELKACEKLHQEHRAQLLNYLKATGIKVGLLINFGREKLEYERFVY